tara:strand:- start:117 stop:383 length:267 start_codon:yes stop_codon:yes gene_type:complete
MMLFLAAISLVVCALAVYLLAPQQHLLQKKPPAGALLMVAVITLLTALWLLTPGYGFWPAFYLTLTLLMLYWMGLPFIIRRKGVKHGR